MNNGEFLGMLLVGTVLSLCMMVITDQEEITTEEYRRVEEMQKRLPALAPYIAEQFDGGKISKWEFRSIITENNRIVKEAEIARVKRTTETLTGGTEAASPAPN